MSAAGTFFDWQPLGVGRRWLPCPRCKSRAPVALLENLLEVLCPACGRNVALERVRAYEADHGAAALAERLVALGVLSEDEEAPAQGLADALIDRGVLRRDLRLTLETIDGGRCVYGARPLGEIALSVEVEAALDVRRERGGVLADILRRVILERIGATVRSVGPEGGLECFTGETVLEPGCRDALTPRALESFHAVPVRREGEALVVALWNPLDFGLVTDLEALLGGTVHAVLGEAVALRAALADLGVALTDASEEGPSVRGEPGDVDAELAEDPFFGILMEALEEGASEVLIEPRGSQASLRFRVRGELRAERALAPEVTALLAEQLEGLTGGGPDGLESSATHSGGMIRSGSIRYEVSGLPVSLDCRILQTPLGPSVALALEDEIEQPRSGLGQLGLSLDGLAALEAILAERRGIVVVAASRGADQTLAYHAILDRAVRLGGGVTSLEGRLGRLVPGTTQLDLGRLDPGSLESLLHPLPDWLGVDGSLTPEVLRLTVDAALQGCAVVLTVPAPDGESALLRLELAGIPRRLLERTVRAVLGRRVVPQVCPHCRFAREPLTPEGSPRWVGLGCAACADLGTGEPLPLAELVRPAPGAGVVPFAATSTLLDRVRGLVSGGEVQPEAVSDLLGGK